MSDFAEALVTTNFSFLRGASHPQDMVLAALLLGYAGIGIADRNSVAGVVRAHGALEDLRQGMLPVEKLREGGGPGEYRLVEPYRDLELPFTQAEMQARAQRFKLIVGARLVFADGTPDIVAYPQDRAGWGQLCQLLTRGNLKAKKGECLLRLPDLLAFRHGLLLIVVPDRQMSGVEEILRTLASATPGDCWLAASMLKRGGDRRRLAKLKGLAEQTGVPLLASNDVLYHVAEQRDLQDVLSCIREGVTLEAAGRRLEANAERYLKPVPEMIRQFADAPQALEESAALFERVHFRLDQLRYDYPQEATPPGWTPQGWLEELTWRHAAMRYEGEVPPKVQRLLREELRLIAKLDYARYFLTIHDIVRVAENKGILCQGRGSAANSAVCYVLGITAVDPAEHDLRSPASFPRNAASRPTSMWISNMSGARRSSSTSTPITVASGRASPPRSSGTGPKAPSARSARCWD